MEIWNRNVRSRTPRATASTASVNNSREWVSAILFNSRGMIRGPTPSINAAKPASFKVASPNAIGRLPEVRAASPNSTGRTTKTNTVRMSSMTSQPTAIRPVEL